MKNYTQHLTSTTPQSRPIPEQRQVKNRAGGHVFPVDDKVRLRRFLILGTVEGSYYAGGRELTREAITVIDRLLEDGQGDYVLDQILDVSANAHAPKQDPAIFALAMALKQGDTPTRRRAATIVPLVCRTFSHMASLIEAIPAFSKSKKDTWGPVTRRAAANWFASKNNSDLAYQLVKYRQRQGWTARDLVRLSHYHVEGWDADRNALLRFALGKDEEARIFHPFIDAFLKVQSEQDPKKVAKLVADNRLPWEAVPSQHAKNLDVQWELMRAMPPGAMLRQLGRLSSLGLITPGSVAAERVSFIFEDDERLKRARLHPMAIYMAAKVYASGKGLRGKLSWTPVPSVVDTLGRAFVRSFGSVQPSGRKIVVAVDCSGSMVNGPDVAGIPGFKPAEAAFTAAWVMAKTEPNASFVAFDTNALDFNFHNVETLEQVGLRARSILTRLGGGTDCAVPIVHSFNEPGVDAFVVYTDEETWAGSVHPIEAVSQYRDRFGDQTKLVSVGFVAHGYSLRNMQDDAGSLGVIGYDDSAPSVIADFIGQKS